jgi:hypothetical protein
MRVLPLAGTSTTLRSSTTHVAVEPGTTEEKEEEEGEEEEERDR